MVPVNETWNSLTADSKQSVCDCLATYSGHDVNAWFAGLVKLAHAKQLAPETNEKRKRDDSDSDQPANKKPKLAEATGSSEPNGIDVASPTSQEQPFRFGCPTVSPATAGTPLSVAPPSPTLARADTSSLKVSAKSNVSPALKAFQAPSSPHQNMVSSAPRKLKCIQCKALYLETQNSAKECYRHTGTRSYFHPMYLSTRN